MKTRLLYVCVFLVSILSGCRRKQADISSAADPSSTSSIDEGILEQLSNYDILPAYINLPVFSPDSEYLAFGLDSVVHFGPGDELWLAEWPDNWFGVRSRKILYVYHPASDSLVKLAQCEEVVNLYLKEDASPIHAERWEFFSRILWSPDAGKLLLLKDREAEGVSGQDILIFTLGVKQPSFLNVFPVSTNLTSEYGGKKGTKIADVSWIDDLRVRAVFSIVDVEAPVFEVIFDIVSGQAVSIDELPST